MPPRALLILLAAFFAAGCGRASTPAQKSPGGTMSLTTSVNRNKADPARQLCVVVDITDAAGKTLHHEVTPVSDTHRWSIRWVSDDELLLRSSDVGSYRIRRQPDGAWTGRFGGE